MSKLDKIFESKAMQKLQQFGGFMQTNKVFQAVSSGMMCTMGLVLAGAISMIIATVLNVVGVLPIESSTYQILTLPYNMTLGIMAVAVAFAVGYNYSKNLGIKGHIANGIASMIMFVMVVAPMQKVTLADGATMNVLDTSYLGASGLFTALFMPIIVVKIIQICYEKNITVRMPDSVPQFLADSFATLVPLVINVVLWVGINTALDMAFGLNVPSAIMRLLSVPLGALISTPGMFVLIAVCGLFWALGLQGTSIIYTVLMPPFIAAYQENAAAVAAGGDPVFNAVFLFTAASACGGFGNVLPLAVQCMRAKSEQLRAVGKAGVIPAVFNISEPLMFGTPIMYNPMLAIPFIANTLITAAIVLVLYQVGFLAAPYVLILTPLPIFVGNFLGSMAIQNCLVTVIAFISGYICYKPFLKAYDRQLLEQEGAAEHEELAAEA